jgi:hypothetical protein
MGPTQSLAPNGSDAKSRSSSNETREAKTHSDDCGGVKKSYSERKMICESDPTE